MSTISEMLGGLRRESDRGKISGKLGEIAHASTDIVAPQQSLVWLGERGDTALDRVHIGNVDGSPLLLNDGVYDSLGAYVTPTAMRQAASRLGVPIKYVDRLVNAGHIDLAALNFNELQTREPRNVTLRLLRGDDGWAVRSIVSDRYNVIDNLDVMRAVVTGLGSAEIDLTDCEIDADWTTDRFRLRIAVPQIMSLAPDLLGDYRSPYSMSPARGVHDAPGADEGAPPALWAGLEIANSETGGGAMVVAPRAVVQWCRNGLTRTVDMLRKVHLGGKLDEGVVQWSDATRRQALDLVTAQIADAASSFCSVDYLNRMLDEMRAAKGITVAPSTAIEIVQKQCSLTDDESRLVLDAFAASGDQSVLGLGNAVTLAAQHADDGDRQSEMESAFWTIVSQPQQYAAAAL